MACPSHRLVRTWEDCWRVTESSSQLLPKRSVVSGLRLEAQVANCLYLSRQRERAGQEDQCPAKLSS